MAEKKAVVFCSASYDINPEYNRAAEKVVRAACSAGYAIVSGGTVKGTMRIVADVASEYGTGCIGILPRFMKGLEHPGLTSLKWTDTMAERKELMREGTSLAIALPGGIGTLDELAETICLAKLGYYNGRILVLNLGGFYDYFKAQLGVMYKEGMLDDRTMALISFPEDVRQMCGMIKNG